MTPLETARAALERAEEATLTARAAYARAALDQARQDGARGSVYERAGLLIGTSGRTLKRMLKVTKNVTSQESE